MQYLDRYQQTDFFFSYLMNKLFSEENNVPRALFEARKV